MPDSGKDEMPDHGHFNNEAPRKAGHEKDEDGKSKSQEHGHIVESTASDSQEHRHIVDRTASDSQKHGHIADRSASDSQEHGHIVESTASDYEERRDFAHRMHSVQIRLLTGAARALLPGGYWTRNRPARDDKKTIHLTFDDGPHPDSTEPILEMLAELDVHATFFVLGSNVERYPRLVEMAAQAGHTIANHSYSHPFLPMLSRRRMQFEVDETNNLIETITGVKPRLFRPPYGLIDKRGADIIAERQMSVVYWGAITDDWHYIGEEAVVRRIGKHLPDEEILVLHENAEVAKQSIGAARKLIKMARDLDMHFTPIH